MNDSRHSYLYTISVNKHCQFTQVESLNFYALNNIQKTAANKYADARTHRPQDGTRRPQTKKGVKLRYTDFSIYT